MKEGMKSPKKGIALVLGAEPDDDEDSLAVTPEFVDAVKEFKAATTDEDAAKALKAAIKLC